MSTSELTAAVTELMELRRMREELDAAIEAAQDAIKADMGERESVIAGPYRIDYKPVTTSRIDTTALKKALPDVAAQFTRTTTARRFTIH